MASFYWYESDKVRLAGEISAMQKFHPDFKLGKLADGRLYWQGKLQPFGKGGTVWEIRLVYSNSYPLIPADDPGWGGAIDTYLVGPMTLEQINQRIGSIPHVYQKNNKLYICTVNGKVNEYVRGVRGYVRTGDTNATTACMTLAWATKWLSLFEMFINGEITYDEMAGDGNF